MSEKYYGISPYSYCGGNPVMFVDPDGEDPKRRIQAARDMCGKAYANETGELRTGNSAQALEKMDCSEFVNRVLYADGITDHVLSQNTATMKSFFGDDTKFIKSETPIAGDIVLWEGHVGIVSEANDSGDIRVIHARGNNKPSMENGSLISPSKYRDSELIGYYRPVEEKYEKAIVYTTEADEPLTAATIIVDRVTATQTPITYEIKN